MERLALHETPDASQEPLRAPWVSTAVFAYAEHEGWNRQRFPRNGLIQRW
jgi:hypothetical protein